MSNFKLRPHHGLCITFFEGKGYHSDFIRHMSDMIHILNTQNPEIELVLHTDRICSACPHNVNQICETDSKVLHYDKQVLLLCGLQPHQKLLWKDFQALTAEKILHQEKLSSVCRNCQWSAICFQKSALTFEYKYDKIK